MRQAFLIPFGMLACSAVLFLGCEDPPRICANDRECTSGIVGLGLCLNARDGARYCAFPFASCPTHFKWSSDALQSDRGNCVTPEMLPKDGGVDASLPDGP